jgi:hypothetical protein
VRLVADEAEPQLQHRPLLGPQVLQQRADVDVVRG